MHFYTKAVRLKLLWCGDGELYAVSGVIALYPGNPLIRLVDLYLYIVLVRQGIKNNELLAFNGDSTYNLVRFWEDTASFTKCVVFCSLEQRVKSTVWEPGLVV